MELTSVRTLFRERDTVDAAHVTVGGWVRSIRDSRTFGFIVLSDGTYFEPVQIVYDNNLPNFAEICKYNVSDVESEYFDELNDVGCYAVCNVVKREYLYYNSAHELLYTSDVRLDKVASDFSMGVSIYSTTVESEIRYYAFY